jgi:hypothetical protein
MVAIFFLNLFLGWTFLGWVAAFVWACTSNTKANRQEEQEWLAYQIALVQWKARQAAQQ